MVDLQVHSRYTLKNPIAHINLYKEFIAVLTGLIPEHLTHTENFIVTVSQHRLIGKRRKTLLIK